MSVYDAAVIFFFGAGLGWLLATVGYGRALQRVAKLYRDEFDRQLNDIRFRIQMLESFKGIQDAKTQTRVVRGP